MNAAVFRGLIVFLCFFAITPAAAKADTTRITAITAFDAGDYGGSESGDPRVDLAQNVCDAENGTLEPFTDTVVGVEIANHEREPLLVNKMSFQVKKGSADGRTIKSKTFAPLERNEIAPAERGSVFGFFLKANGAIKVLPARGGDVALGTGFRNVTAIVSGRTTAGKKITLKAKVTLSFSDYDRCTEN